MAWGLQSHSLQHRRPRSPPRPGTEHDSAKLRVQLPPRAPTKTPARSDTRGHVWDAPVICNAWSLGSPRVPECSQREAVTALSHLYRERWNTDTHMRSKSVSFNFPLCSDWRRIRSAQGQLEVGVFGSQRAFDPCACAKMVCAGSNRGGGEVGGLTPALTLRPGLGRIMAPSLLLLSLPWPVRPGPLHRCWELLQRQLQQCWNGFASPQWGP